ncbi:MAG TPA: hypothetical protein VJ654_17845 [Noviherbaspirillum sp.]|nr:hypothetical protein [Noviherbaspirillum sp.]
MITSATQQRLSGSILTATSAVKENKSANRLPLSGGGTELTTVDSAVVALGTATSLADVAKKYDVQNMSPREMAAMSQELYQAGAISFQDHALLSFQPEFGPQYKNLAGQPGNLDTPRDFIAQWNEQLQIHKKNGEMSFVKNDYRILNILGNLASLHESPVSA